MGFSLKVTLTSLTGCTVRFLRLLLMGKDSRYQVASASPTMCSQRYHCRRNQEFWISSLYKTLSLLSSSYRVVHMHTQMIVLKAAFRNKGDFLVTPDDPKTFSVLLPVQRGGRFSCWSHSSLSWLFLKTLPFLSSSFHRKWFEKRDFLENGMINNVWTLTFKINKTKNFLEGEIACSVFDSEGTDGMPVSHS